MSHISPMEHLVTALTTVAPAKKASVSSNLGSGSTLALKVNSSPPPNKHDYSFKIITLGKSGVGKTSLSIRYTSNVFSEQSATLGLDYSWKSIQLGNKNVFLRVWDTAGHERYRQIVQQYVRKSDGVILAYDITDPSSIDEIRWYLDFANTCGAEKAVKILVGCKADMHDQRKISKDVGQAIAEELDINFFETSAKESLNVEAVFRTLSTEILERRMHSNFSPVLQSSPASGRHGSVEVLTMRDADSAKERKKRRKFPLCW